MALLAASVTPEREFLMTVTSSWTRSVKASMMPRRYSARLVFHRPGSGEVSDARIRYASAHSLPLSFGGDFHARHISLFLSWKAWICSGELFKLLGDLCEIVE